MKKGFGLLEVIIAAVVLAFLIIGLNTLQKGNRESILRIRTRDVANSIAQDVIDSISALGPASVAAGSPPPLQKIHVFDGMAGGVEVQYEITVNVQDATDEQKAVAETEYTKIKSVAATHQFAKQIDVTVAWLFKKAPQSINVSTVIQ